MFYASKSPPRWRLTRIGRLLDVFFVRLLLRLLCFVFRRGLLLGRILLFTLFLLIVVVATLSYAVFVLFWIGEYSSLFLSWVLFVFLLFESKSLMTTIFAFLGPKIALSSTHFCSWSFRWNRRFPFRSRLDQWRRQLSLAFHRLYWAHLFSYHCLACSLWRWAPNLFRRETNCAHFSIGLARWWSPFFRHQLLLPLLALRRRSHFWMLRWNTRSSTILKLSLVVHQKRLVSYSVKMEIQWLCIGTRTKIKVCSLLF